MASRNKVGSRKDRNKSTMASIACEALRERIVEGHFRPNQRLVEAELGELLNMSRTPIREALRLLAVDGLTYPEHAGWVVREHTPAEIAEIFETRAALESHSARLAAARATDEQLENIRIALNENDGKFDLDRSVLVKVNSLFHDSVAVAAANPMLMNLATKSRYYFFNVRLAKLYTDEELRKTHEEHREIYHALTERDSDRAADAVRRHVEFAGTMAAEKLF